MTVPDAALIAAAAACPFVNRDALLRALEAAAPHIAEPLFAALAELLFTVASECPLTDRVMAAADKVRVAMVALGMRDTGPPP